MGHVQLEQVLRLRDQAHVRETQQGQLYTMDTSTELLTTNNGTTDVSGANGTGSHCQMDGKLCQRRWATTLTSSGLWCETTMAATNGEPIAYYTPEDRGTLTTATTAGPALNEAATDTAQVAAVAGCSSDAVAVLLEAGSGGCEPTGQD